VFEKYRTIHFVGIGGIGMSGIAEVLHNLGYEVTGSDLRESDTIARLRDLGIKVMTGHRPENIDDAHVVVISSAVSVENPEVIAAREKSVPVIPRAEMLAELGRLKYGILIAGAHGKTTTTSLIATILGHAGLDPTVVIGGKLRATGSNARLGKGDFIIAEADESDGSFLKLTPTIAVVTNIDREHMDFFKNMDALKEAFVSFINKVPFYGLSILCVENELIREILPRVHRRYLTYGFSEEADVCATNVERGFMSMSFNVKYRGQDAGRFFIPMPGVHSVLNCLASIIVARELKIGGQDIKEALKGFHGIQRRFEFKGEAGGIKFFDDYGHHPVEIRATLRAARESLANTDVKEGRVFVLFQPHRYTRTADLLREFGSSFSDADVLCVMDIYAAGEKPIKGVSSEAVLRAVKDNGHMDAVYIPDKKVLFETIAKKLRPGDLFITVGAGDVWKTGEELLKRMKDNVG
jgi:UDP-N-acetylmuramate--alanine ligase